MYYEILCVRIFRLAISNQSETKVTWERLVRYKILGKVSWLYCINTAAVGCSFCATLQEWLWTFLILHKIFFNSYFSQFYQTWIGSFLVLIWKYGFIGTFLNVFWWTHAHYSRNQGNCWQFSHSSKKLYVIIIYR